MSNSNAAFDLKNVPIIDGFLSPESKAKVQATEDLAIEWLPIESIHPGSIQPRQFFSEEGIESLASSFRSRGFHGVLNVRPAPDGKGYELIAGERRWRAARLAGLTKVRCVITPLGDEEALEFALVENLLREDLSKLEETEGVLSLIEQKLRLDRERVLEIIRTEGHPDQRSRCNVSPSEELQAIESILDYFNIELQTFRTRNLRTLLLPEEIKQAHLQGNLPYTSALEIAKIKDDRKRKALLKKVLEQKLSFREIKEAVQEIKQKQATNSKSSPSPSVTSRLKAVTKRLSLIELSKVDEQKLGRLLNQLEALCDEASP